jgi:hypothetical protein
MPAGPLGTGLSYSPPGRRAYTVKVLPVWQIDAIREHTSSQIYMALRCSPDIKTPAEMCEV